MFFGGGFGDNSGSSSSSSAPFSFGSAAPAAGSSIFGSSATAFGAPTSSAFSAAQSAPFGSSGAAPSVSSFGSSFASPFSSAFGSSSSSSSSSNQPFTSFSAAAPPTSSFLPAARPISEASTINGEHAEEDDPFGGSKRRLGFCWGRQGNDFLLWRARPRNERELKVKQPPQVTAAPDTIWTGSLDAQSIETHKLFSEAHTVFMELQKYAVEFAHRPELMREARKKSSKNYRAVIAILINNLQQRLTRLEPRRHHHRRPKLEADDDAMAADADGDAQKRQHEREEVGAQLALWKAAEVVWHLCDIFFVAHTPDAIITEPLVTWLQHFDVTINGEVKSREELDQLIRDIVSSPEPHKHEFYWPVFYKLVLRGQILKALELLYAHPERRAQAAGATGAAAARPRRVAKSSARNAAAAAASTGTLWLKVEALLKQTPVFRSGDTLLEFESHWEHWRADCRSLQAQAEAKGDDDLLVLFSLLSGEESALLDLSNSWHEFLVGRLLYAEPTTKAVEFRYLTEQATQHFPPTADAFERILVSVMNFEPYEALQHSFELLRWWFAAHLADLLHHAGLVEDIALDEGGSLREHYMIGFVRDELLGSGQAASSSAWRLAVDYLSFCPAFGPAHMRHLLARVPLDSERQAYKALTVCAHHNLPDQAKLIFMIMGMQKYRERRYGASIQWFLRAAHPTRLSQVANRLVEDYYAPGAATSRTTTTTAAATNVGVDADEVTAVVEQLDRDFVFSERLVFLSKVRDLNRFKQEQNWRAVAALTVEVISKSLAPRRYWIRLLRDVVPLLEATPVLFDFEQTEVLMAALEDITSAHYSRGYTRHVTEDELVALRLALARNRARAICLA